MSNSPKNEQLAVLNICWSKVIYHTSLYIVYLQHITYN